MSSQKSSYVAAVTWPVIFALLLSTGMVLSIAYAYHFLRSADTPQKTEGADYQPRMLLITNEQQVTANVQIGYYAGYNSSIGSLTSVGGLIGTFPIRIRYITIAFSGAQPGTTLEFAILLNKDAAEVDVYGLPFASPRHLPEDPISVGIPGSSIIPNCALPENTFFSQVMFGGIPVASDGSANTQIAGLLVNQHPYLATGDTNIVNVMEFLPEASATAATGAGRGCHWLFPDSPYLGGVRWYSPATLTGSVDIGTLPGDYTVQVSNPALADLSSLAWDFSGPTAINYILNDNAVAREAGDHLFWAGVLAALATGFFVELLKTCYEVHGVRGEVREKREQRKEKAEEKMELQKDKEEARKERKEERKTLARIVTAKRETRPDFVTVLEVAGLTALTHWLASVFRRTR